MKFITVAGPPSSGKTSIILKLIEAMNIEPNKIGVVKFDCLTSFDNLRYEEKGILVRNRVFGKTLPGSFLCEQCGGCGRMGHSIRSEDAHNGKRRAMQQMLPLSEWDFIYLCH